MPGLASSPNDCWLIRRDVGVLTIDDLPDDDLLAIFDFYVVPYQDLNFFEVMFSDQDSETKIQSWHSLVHVCRRWRGLVFASPRRLNLQLYYDPGRFARKTLDVWPALPLLVTGSLTLSSGTDDVIAALLQSKHIFQINLHLTAGWQLENILAAMQVSFPELTQMQLILDDDTLSAQSAITVPDSFLGGYAPSLQYFELDGIPFPGLPNLLSSANHLVFLCLSNIPHSGYISPEAMIALLSVSSNLRTLFLEFRSPRSPPGSESPNQFPPKRSILPAFKKFHFKGVTEYLEELVNGIDTPQLHEMNITFFNQIDFDCGRLAQLITRTPTLRAIGEARVQFDNSTASIKLRFRTSRYSFEDLVINISCREPDWQLSSVEQVSISLLHPLSAVEDLYIAARKSELVWKNDAIENALCLQLLLPFIAVKNLHLSKEFAPGIAAALRGLVGGRITEVLPSLQKIFVEGLGTSGPVPEDIGQFVAARQLSALPVAISVWYKTW